MSNFNFPPTPPSLFTGEDRDGLLDEARAIDLGSKVCGSHMGKAGNPLPRAAKSCRWSQAPCTSHGAFLTVRCRLLNRSLTILKLTRV